MFVIHHSFFSLFFQKIPQDEEDEVEDRIGKVLQ